MARSFHLHASGIKSAPAGPRVNTPDRTSYVRPSFHPQDARVALVHASNATAALDAAFPWLDVMDFGQLARALRRARHDAPGPAAPLCRVPRHIAPLVEGFCRTYHRPAVHTWNCTHLPCAVLQPAGAGSTQAQEVDCVVARSFRYRCRMHRSLAALRRGVPVVMDGRFTVDPDTFYAHLGAFRTPAAAWLFHLAGESLETHPAAGDPAVLARFNWTLGYDRRIFDEATATFLRGPLERFLSPLPTLDGAPPGSGVSHAAAS